MKDYKLGPGQQYIVGQNGSERGNTIEILKVWTLLHGMHLIKYKTVKNVTGQKLDLSHFIDCGHNPFAKSLIRIRRIRQRVLGWLAAVNFILTIGSVGAADLGRIGALPQAFLFCLAAVIFAVLWDKEAAK